MQLYKLNQLLLDMHSGGTPDTSKPEYWNGNFKWLSSGETRQRFIENTESRITQLGIEKSSTKLAKKNDVVMACAGQGKTRGQVSFLLDDMYINQSVIAMTTDEKILHPLYLFYNLSGRYNELRGSSDASSTRGSITTKSLKKLAMLIPNIESQKNITYILIAYDNLIENNNKRIKLLEQMSENLYKEWFLRFRFPGYENVEFVGSSLGKLPSTFDIVKIGKVIEYYIGGGWGEEELSELFPEEAYVVRGTDFPNVKHGILDSCPLRYHKSSNYNKRLFKVNDVAFEVSGGAQKQPVGRSILITERQLNRFNNRLICASFCKLIRCNIKKVSPRYFYHWLQYLYETRIIEQYQSQSTGIINFKFEYFLRKCNLLIPPKDIMEKFTELVKPIYDEIDNLAEQNSKLNDQRDMLLPRLMSGKLEV